MYLLVGLYLLAGLFDLDFASSWSLACLFVVYKCWVSGLKVYCLFACFGEFVD